FIPQVVFCFFAEALRILPVGCFTNRILDCKRDPAKAADILYSFFCQLNDAKSKKLPYVNGDAFANPVFLELIEPELEILWELADFKWEHVSPVIFGNILESFRQSEY